MEHTITPNGPIGINPVFVLGAADPEMIAIERVLSASGFSVRIASALDAKFERVPLNPGNAYSVLDEHALWEGGEPVRVRGHVVWVECRPRGETTASLRERGDLVIDHHNPGDDGFGAPPSQAFEASSLGQLKRLMPMLGTNRDDAEEWMRFDVLIREPALVAIGCLDHCLHHALAGRTVAPASLALATYAQSFADEELSARLRRRPVSVDEVHAGIEADRAALRLAPVLTIAGHEVRDLTGLPTGTLRWAPVAAGLARLAYLALAPARDGVPPTVTLGGDTTPELVQAFLDAGIRAVAAHRIVLAQAEVRAREADGATGAVESMRAADALAAFDAVRAKGRDGLGVYGDPARGFAGCYAPIAALRAVLAWCSLTAQQCAATDAESETR